LYPQFGPSTGSAQGTGQALEHWLTQHQDTTPGFVNTRILKYKMPIRPWPKDPMLKEASKFGLVALYGGLYGMSVRLFREVLGWSEEQLQVLLVGFRKDLTKKSIHSYWPMYEDKFQLVQDLADVDPGIL
jgi:hypothetical protein